MITPEERTAIIKAIGNKHIKKIQDYLISHNILTPKEKVYSKTVISYVLSGERENEILENAIFAFAHFKILEKEKSQELRNKVVSAQKN